jgi:hypothetical protein
MFSTYDGLRSIATQAGCCRLLAVTCNQPHYFPPLTSSVLQDELSPIVITLKPRSESLPNKRADDKMPFIAIESDNDWTTIKTGSTNISGSYIVEETDDDDVDGALLRRLIFLQNQNFIQTEIRIVPKKNTSSSSNNKKNKKKNNKSTPSSNTASITTEYDYDYSYSDDIYISTLLAFLLSPKIIINGIKSNSSNSNSNKQDLERVVSTAKNDVVFNFQGTTTVTIKSTYYYYYHYFYDYYH